METRSETDDWRRPASSPIGRIGTCAEETDVWPINFVFFSRTSIHNHLHTATKYKGKMRMGWFICAEELRVNKGGKRRGFEMENGGLKKERPSPVRSEVRRDRRERGLAIAKSPGGGGGKRERGTVDQLFRSQRFDRCLMLPYLVPVRARRCHGIFSEQSTGLNLILLLPRDAPRFWSSRLRGRSHGNALKPRGSSLLRDIHAFRMQTPSRRPHPW